MNSAIVIDYTQKAIKWTLPLILIGVAVAASLIPASAAPFDSPLPPAPNKLQLSAWMPTSWDGDAARASFDAHSDSLTAISPYWYSVRPDGSLAPMAGSRVAGLVNQARAAGVLILPTISNLFERETLHAILNDAALAEAHRRAIVAEVGRYGYDGIDLDYENLAAADKDQFSAWAAALADDLHARGKRLTITVQPKTFDADGWNGPGALDYRALAGAADELRLMTYGWCWSSGCVGSDPPGPIAPVHWMQRVIDYAKTQAPASKLVLGVHLYGYDWEVGSNQYSVTSERYSGAVSEDVTGRALVWEEAQALQTEHHAALQWWEADDRGLVREPWFSYAEGAHHVTFADADSVAARAQLAADAGLRGIIFWRLGGEDPALWERIPKRIYRAWLPILSDGQSGSKSTHRPTD
jgi:spore germination protein YaaH